VIVNSLGAIPKITHGVCNRKMKTVEENRRDWIDELVQRFGSIANLNAKLDRDRTDATLSQIKNQSPHHKTCKPRTMGSEIARDIEVKLNLERGALDYPPNGATQTPAQPLRIAYAVNEASPPDYPSAPWPFKTVTPREWASILPDVQAVIEQQVKAMAANMAENDRAA
jgi:hypothetical protein